MGADGLSKLGRLERLVWGRAMMAGWVTPKVGTFRAGAAPAWLNLEKRARPEEDSVGQAAILWTLMTQINLL